MVNQANLEQYKIQLQQVSFRKFSPNVVVLCPIQIRPETTRLSSACSAFTLQVEAALSAEPENEKLKKLKKNLKGTIAIMAELVVPSVRDASSPDSASGDGQDDSAPGSSGSKPSREWRVSKSDFYFC